MDQTNQSNLTDKKLVECSSNKVSLETELSETLYNTMKDFVLSNPTWDQYKLINSALKHPTLHHIFLQLVVYQDDCL